MIRCSLGYETASRNGGKWRFVVYRDLIQQNVTLLVPGADWLLGGGALQDISQTSTNIPELQDKTRNDVKSFLTNIPEVLFNWCPFIFYWLSYVALWRPRYDFQDFNSCWRWVLWLVTSVMVLTASFQDRAKVALDIFGFYCHVSHFWHLM